MAQEDRTEGDASEGFGFANTNVYQAAILNKLLPPGFKFELEQDVQRNVISRRNNAQSLKSKQQQMKKKKPGQFLPGKKQTSMQGGSSMGGSELGDNDGMDSFKPG